MVCGRAPGDIAAQAEAGQHSSVWPDTWSFQWHTEIRHNRYTVLDAWLWDKDDGRQLVTESKTVEIDHVEFCRWDVTECKCYYCASNYTKMTEAQEDETLKNKQKTATEVFRFFPSSSFWGNWKCFPSLLNVNISSSGLWTKTEFFWISMSSFVSAVYTASHACHSSK